MDEDYEGVARFGLRISAALVAFGAFMAMRHLFSVVPGVAGPSLLPFWLPLILAAGVLVGAVEFEEGVLAGIGTLIGGVSSLVGLATYTVVILYAAARHGLWRNVDLAVEVLVYRGLGICFAGFLVGTLLSLGVLRSALNEYRGANSSKDDGA